MRYAVIENGVVTNAIMLASPDDLLPEDGQTFVQSDVASVGYTYADGVFTAPAVEPEAAHAILLRNAQAALWKTDSVYLRAAKDGHVWTDEWKAYTAALRAIVNGTDTTSTALPTMPAYPS